MAFYVTNQEKIDFVIDLSRSPTACVLSRDPAGEDHTASHGLDEGFVGFENRSSPPVTPVDGWRIFKGLMTYTVFYKT